MFNLVEVPGYSFRDKNGNLANFQLGADLWNSVNFC
jgi:hypothetical protein